jgi:antitoxin CptB
MTEPDHPAPDIRRRRLLFRATHRGTFENDLMIGGFVRAHLATLTEADLDALEAVMEMPDTVLAGWLTGRVPIPPEEETLMLRRMRDFQTPNRRDAGDFPTQSPDEGDFPTT